MVDQTVNPIEEYAEEEAWMEAAVNDQMIMTMFNGASIMGNMSWFVMNDNGMFKKGYKVLTIKRREIRT